MGLLKLHSTSIAEWHDLVLEAEQQCGMQLNEELQNYLIITLDSYTTDKKLTKNILALEFFDSLQQTGKQGVQQLRIVGDQCLLLAGLFPESAERKNVSPAYFTQIGEQAYAIIAVKHTNRYFDRDLFLQLSQEFIGLKELLYSMRILKPKLIH
ncbi:MAG: hypothetical protein K0U12_03830 [Gammaproteobacteria bacterium]|nr:hypothetical protein [Gammaproteobacteria bacterium]